MGLPLKENLPLKNFKKIKLKLHPERIPYFFYSTPKENKK